MLKILSTVSAMAVTTHHLSVLYRKRHLVSHNQYVACPSGGFCAVSIIFICEKAISQRQVEPKEALTFSAQKQRRGNLLFQKLQSFCSHLHFNVTLHFNYFHVSFIWL